jgi:hypothetical protein
MKIKSILIILLIVMVGSSESQIFKGIGIKTGISVANQTWKYSEPYLDNMYKCPPGSVPFFNIGVFGEFLSTKYISTTFDIWYTRKGADFKYDTKDMYGNVTGTEEVEVRIKYFSLVLAEKFRIESERKAFGVYISAGPRIDLRLSKEYDIDFAGAYENANVTSFGLALAGGVSFLIKQGRVLAEFFYNPDFTGVIDKPNGYVKNYDWGIRIGLEVLSKTK